MTYAYSGNCCINNNEVSSAIDLLKLKNASNPKIIIVINETIKKEWDDNIKSTIIHLEKEIRKANDAYRDIISIYKNLNQDLTVNYLDLQHINLAVNLEKISSNFLDNAYILCREDGHSVNAMKRIFQNILPAQKGKSEPKDCEIFEAFLDLSSALRKDKYQGDILFVTSNHHDYGKPGIDSSLNEELDKIDSKLVNSLSWALSISTENA